MGKSSAVAVRLLGVFSVEGDEKVVGRGWDAWCVVGLTTPLLRPGHKKTSGVAPEGKDSRLVTIQFPRGAEITAMAEATTTETWTETTAISDLPERIM